MDIRTGNYCCSMDQEPVVYIEDQYSEGFLLSSLVIPTTRQPTESFAEVSILQVPFQRVVATTLITQVGLEEGEKAVAVSQPNMKSSIYQSSRQQSLTIFYFLSFSLLIHHFPFLLSLSLGTQGQGQDDIIVTYQSHDKGHSHVSHGKVQKVLEG